MTSGHWSKTGLTLLLLLVCLIAVNVIAFFLPVRLDITEDRLYTIAKGTRSVLEGLQDPVRIKFYFSRSSAELTPNLKIYAQRVQELLGEIEVVSGGKVTLEVFDPKPDSDEEDWAQKYGISPITLRRPKKLASSPPSTCRVDLRLCKGNRPRRNGRSSPNWKRSSMSKYWMLESRKLRKTSVCYS